MLPGLTAPFVAVMVLPAVVKVVVGSADVEVEVAVPVLVVVVPDVEVEVAGEVTADAADGGVMPVTLLTDEVVAPASVSE